jgi:hypothetical protein
MLSTPRLCAAAATLAAAGKVRALTLPAARVRSGVDAYRLTYATIGVDGAPTTATGLLVLPRNRAGRLRTVTVAPDYLGLRRGPGSHPYMHAASEASAALDMLRGARVRRAPAPHA